MFTNNIITLATLLKRAKIPATSVNLIRDCQLSHIAKVPTRVTRKVVPCCTSNHLEDAIETTQVVGVIVPEQLAQHVPAHLGLAVSSDPIATTNHLHRTLCEDATFHWESFESTIDSSAQIHPTAYVSPKDVVIGCNSVIHAGAIILPRTVIGDHSSIGCGTVVGTEAFEVDNTVSPQKILSQAGGVSIGDHVDIQAKCTIVRATFGGFTVIGNESKFDCQIHLAHDCRIGERVRIAACAGISGRVTIGNDTFIGPNCSISNGVFIGEKSHITIGAVVVKDVGDAKRVSGNFAVAHQKFISHIKAIR